ncbi:MAG: hypothetical protein ABI178_10455 [Rhodanobacter sp.]
MDPIRKPTLAAIVQGGFATATIGTGAAALINHISPLSVQGAIASGLPERTALVAGVVAGTRQCRC